MDQAMTILLYFVILLCYRNRILLQRINIFIVYRRQKFIFFIVYRRQYGNAICPRERFASTKTPTKDGKYRRWAWENLYFLWRSDPSRLLLNILVAFREMVMYQIVTICLLDFYLVEDVDSRDAENEGLSLILRFKWLSQGIFWLVDGVKTPPPSCAFTSDCLCFSLGFWVGIEREEGLLDLLTKAKCKEQA